MATPAEIQAQLDTTGKGPTILRMQNTIGTTLDSFYVDGGIPTAGRCMWIDTTAANTASQQADTIRAALLAYR